MLARLIGILAFIGLFGGALFWLLTRAVPLPEGTLAGLTGDAERGAPVFHAAGCASCHTAEGAEWSELPVLAGGRRFVTNFGTFVAPNISPDPDHGIGGWSAEDLANAMIRGLSPAGEHYYPAFPYASYATLTRQDAVDLHAFINSLPASDLSNDPHDLSFPFTLRRGIGFWKAMNEGGEWVLDGELDPVEARGRYLVESLAHCGECHTPRDVLGGLRYDRWLAGAPNPSGEGRIPNITPAALTWDDAALMTYLTLGFTPEFDTAGGTMAAVVKNLAHLPEDDRAAIIAYLRLVRPVD